jgi:membrane-bound inhibitor of C-type lysozyme
MLGAMTRPHDPRLHAPFMRPRGAAPLVALALVLVLAACATGGDEMEPSHDTFSCKLHDERIVVRFTEQEARVLMPPDEHLVTLYQLPGGSGVRYSNGLMEMRGSADGANLSLIREGQATALTGCEPLKVPKKSSNPFLLK